MSSEKTQQFKRPPIVVVMGHVDHGKTALLDHIRKTSVVEGEAGGITQSIGAYEIVYAGKKITFLDTPGHEAFSKMRERGAKIADIAILVVAADEGVKPQTEDALKYIRKEDMPFLVAINKIDKRNADIERTKQGLVKAGVLLEGMGGNVSAQLVSAKTGEGVSELLDLILLAAEIENFTYNPENPAKGVVLTARPDPKRGLAVGVIITDGTLKKGDEVHTPSTSGKVKVLEDFLGKEAAELIPSAPAVIVGFQNTPEVGEEFSTNLEAIEKKAAVNRFAGKKAESEKTDLRVILKAGEAGSLEALSHIIEKTAGARNIVIIDKSPGNIHESDIKLAGTTGAIILGFHVKTDKVAENTAKMQDLVIMTSDVIYDLEKNLEEYLSKKAGQEKATIEVLATFGKLKNGKQVVGGRVITGPVKNRERFEVVEGGTVIGSGKIVNLQSGKKDVALAEKGVEAGLLVETSTEIKAGHQLTFGNK
ncbi:MAG: translation initiation factor IF-2 [Candidatus Jorgensenbacteria bacterium]